MAFSTPKSRAFRNCNPLPRKTILQISIRVRENLMMFSGVLGYQNKNLYFL